MTTIVTVLALMTACSKPDRDDEAVALSTKIISEGLSDANHALERVDSAEQADMPPVHYQKKDKPNNNK